MIEMDKNTMKRTNADTSTIPVSTFPSNISRRTGFLEASITRPYDDEPVESKEHRLRKLKRFINKLADVTMTGTGGNHILIVNNLHNNRVISEIIS